ncbi:hypothetical protein GCM10009634_26340 [Saccharothrix xinjiangensis]
MGGIGLAPLSTRSAPPAFDDPRAIGRETAWLRQRGLLGAMIREMSGDTAGGVLINAVDVGLR